MTLKEKLQKIADASAKHIPAEARAVMHRTTQAVADSLANRNIPKVGQALPSFELPDSRGNLPRSNNLVEQGPLVLSFFRGKW